MRDSGQPTPALGDLVKIRAGIPLKSSRERELDAFSRGESDLETLVINARALPNWDGIDSDHLKETSFGVEEQHILSSGDVLFANRGKNTFAWVFDSDSVECERCAAGNQFLVLRTSACAELVPGYLSWFLNHQAVQSQLALLAQGSEVRIVRASDLKGLQIPIFDRSKQEKIARAWSAYLYWSQSERAVLDATREWVMAATSQYFDRNSLTASKGVDQ